MFSYKIGKYNKKWGKYMNLLRRKSFDDLLAHTQEKS